MVQEDNLGSEKGPGLNLAEDEMKISAQQLEDTGQNEHTLYVLSSQMILVRMNTLFINLSFQSQTTIRDIIWRYCDT